MSYSDCFVSMQPDYLEEIFDFYPEDNISFSIEKHQNSYSGIEDIKYVSDLSNNSQASFSFSLENFSEADRDELLDVYLNETKANGISNSFLFKHPIYAEYFICKFTKEVEDTLYRHGRYSQQNVNLDIIGVDRNLISAIETINVSEISTLEKSIISSSIDTTGKILTISFDSNCYIGESYANSHIELNSYLLGSLVSVSYTSGQSTPSLQFDIQDITLIDIDSIFVSFSGHQDSIEYVSGDDIIDFRNFYVSNNSTVTLPSIVSVYIEETGGTLSIEFDKNVIISSGYEDGEIILRVNGVYYPLEYIQGSGGKILFFNITNIVFSNEVCFISLIGSGDGIKNVDGYDIENFNNISVINSSLITPGYIYPRLGRVVLATDGVSVDMLFDSAVFISSGGSGGFFINGSPLSYTSGSGGAELQFQSSECFLEGEILYLSYYQPGNGIEDEDGDDLQNMISISVENNSIQQHPEILYATIGATGDSLTIVFSEAVTQGSGYLDSDFNLDASVSGSNISIAYSSGDGTDTHVYSVNIPIQSGEVVNLDYNGRSGGIEDFTGNDLAEIIDMAVTNNSENSGENYDDILFWDGFDGSISGATYTSSSGDYPTAHTGTLEGSLGSTDYERIEMDTVKKAVGASSMAFPDLYTTAIKFALVDKPTNHAGRFGFWLNYGSSYAWSNELLAAFRESDDFYSTRFLVQGEGTANPPRRVYVRYYLGNTLYLNRTVTLTDTTVKDLWVFIEVSWSQSQMNVYMDGVLKETVDYDFGAFPETSLGQFAFGGGGLDRNVDNLIISNDPSRDLYALALLEAYPGVQKLVSWN